MSKPDANKRSRVFFALVPDAATQESLGIIARGIASRAGGRAIVDANLHLTLAFIGEVHNERLEILRTLVGTLPRRAFALELDTIGTFHHSDLTWIAPSNVPTALTQLQSALTDALTNAHFALETRPFHAHITLARRCARNISGAHAEVQTWRVERVALLASIARENGVAYRELAGLRLA
ncbi:MAG TPA: RNA 2',3'-cyclic phosphodiesterase [Casimicrobiaceae bacterium]|jgi:2'-5' RNA ligase